MKKQEKNQEKQFNCCLRATLHNGFINFYVDLDDLDNIGLRLIVPNRKLAYKIYKRVNKEAE